MTTSIATNTTRESVFVRLIHEMPFVSFVFTVTAHIPSHVNIRPYTECPGLHPLHPHPHPFPLPSPPLSLPLPRPPNNVLCSLSHPSCLSPRPLHRHACFVPSVYVSRRCPGRGDGSVVGVPGCSRTSVLSHRNITHVSRSLATWLCDALRETVADVEYKAWRLTRLYACTRDH